MSFLRDLFVFLVIFQICTCLKDTQDCAGYDCLKNYIDRPEPLYKWTDLGHRLEVEDFEGSGGWTGYVLNFTSQQWLSEDIGG